VCIESRKQARKKNGGSQGEVEQRSRVDTLRRTGALYRIGALASDGPTADTPTDRRWRVASGQQAVDKSSKTENKMSRARVPPRRSTGIHEGPDDSAQGTSRVAFDRDWPAGVDSRDVRRPAPARTHPSHQWTPADRFRAARNKTARHRRRAVYPLRPSAEPLPTHCRGQRKRVHSLMAWSAPMYPCTRPARRCRRFPEQAPAPPSLASVRPKVQAQASKNEARPTTYNFPWSFVSNVSLDGGDSRHRNIAPPPPAAANPDDARRRRRFREHAPLPPDPNCQTTPTNTKSNEQHRIFVH